MIIICLDGKNKLAVQLSNMNLSKKIIWYNNAKIKSGVKYSLQFICDYDRVEALASYLLLYLIENIDWLNVDHIPCTH